jgi:Pyruvate/2-oxoacid:ferredoxin oxidoreductase gamma subunit
MKAKKIVSIFLVILLLSGSCITGLAATASGPSIYIELSNSTANVGDIIKASVKIEGIRDFSGYQANLKYDPTVLVPCDPDTGEHYNNKTVPKGNTVLNNKDYTPLSMQSYDFDKGLLNFGCAYMMLPEYSLLGHNEASGTLAVIGFKVINKAESTKIAFKSSERMPGSIDVTILFGLQRQDNKKL